MIRTSVQIVPGAEVTVFLPSEGVWSAACVRVSTESTTVYFGPDVSQITARSDRANAELLRQIAAAAVEAAEFHEARAAGAGETP